MISIFFPTITKHFQGVKHFLAQTITVLGVIFCFTASTPAIAEDDILIGVADSGIDIHFPVTTLKVSKKVDVETISEFTNTLAAGGMEIAHSDISGYTLAFNYYEYGYGYETLSRQSQIASLIFEINSPISGNELVFPAPVKLTTDTTIHNFYFYIPLPNDAYDIDIGYGIGEKKYTFDFSDVYNGTQAAAKATITKLSMNLGMTFTGGFRMSIGYNTIFGPKTQVDLTNALLDSSGSPTFSFAKGTMNTNEEYITLRLGVGLAIFAGAVE